MLCAILFSSPLTVICPASAPVELFSAVPSLDGAIEEKLQNGDAGAGHRSVSRGIGGVGGRTLREGLRKKVTVVRLKAGHDRVRVQDGRAKLTLDRVALTCLFRVHDCAARFRAMAQMHKP